MVSAVKKLFTRITSLGRKGLCVCFRKRVDRRFILCFHGDFNTVNGKRGKRKACHSEHAG